MYRHLFFDLDNTLWDFDRNSQLAMYEVWVRNQLPEDDFERFFTIYNIHNDRLWAAYREHRITKQELSTQRFSLSLDEAGYAGIDGTGFNYSYLEAMPNQTMLCSGALEILQRLSGRFRMHIITNGFAEVQHRKMELSGLLPFFDRIFISELVQAPKPSPEIFRHALKSCNARKRESVMIGDSWEVDILGAKAEGIDQIFYNPNGVHIDEDVQKGRGKGFTMQISHLSEIPLLLEI